MQTCRTCRYFGLCGREEYICLNKESENYNFSIIPDGFCDNWENGKRDSVEQSLLSEIQEYFTEREGWDKDEVINDVLNEIDYMKGKYPDEIGVVDDEGEFTDLDTLLNDFFIQTLKKVSNVIESYKDKNAC